MSVTAYPLCWPIGWERTSVRSHKAFKNSTFARGRDRLSRELHTLGATEPILSTCIPLKVNGDPVGTFNYGRISDPGVAVYFKLSGRPMIMARDAYHDIVSNITSLALAINYLRGLNRHGGAAMMERAFSGFVALPAPGTMYPCWDILGLKSADVLVLLDPNDRANAINTAYRVKAKRLHSDVGGSDDQMSQLNRARDEALVLAGVP